LIDTFGPGCIQKKLGGGAPNSVVVIDRDGKIALWQIWAEDDGLRKKLEEMTGNPSKG
jgi:hypothetical protein